MADTNLGRVTFNLRGTWSGSVLDYKRLDVVNYTIGGRSISFASKIDNPTETPSLGSAEWMEIGYEGLKGDKGDAFTFNDFTPEQVTLLQQPAIDAADNANNAADNANGAFNLFKNYVNALFGITQVQTVAIIDRAFDEGFALPLSNRLHALDNLIYDLKQGFVWDGEDLLLNFVYNQLGLEGFSRINHKKPTGDLITLVGGLIYTINGFEGNGIDGYINTNFNPATGTNNYLLNSASRGAVIYKNTQSGATNGAGIDSAGAVNFNSIRNAVSSVQQLNSGNVSSPADLSGTGYKGISRTASTGVSIINKSVKTNFLSNSTVIRNDTQRLFMTEGLCSDIGISGYHLGASRTDAQNLAYRTAYNKYFAAIGLPQIA